ncbi:response regulator [Nitrosopumilus ureiphilus]|uniref:response regulator n=1 Tax=Nitrosopumilus ureiphilus TaxID=1470067 RepID=UPI001FE3CE7F|nr:response regulator [Nitrosopumilus ureiphilus]
MGTGHNGKEAVDLYEKHKPDIVTIDSVTPKFDGIYATENIHKINPNAKIIMVTGNDGSSFTYLEELGVTAILQKPCSMNKLVDTINKI